MPQGGKENCGGYYTVPLAFVWVMDFSGTSQVHTVFPKVVVTRVAPSPFV